MSPRERRLENLLLELLAVLDHGERCRRCVVEFEEHAAKRFERIKREARKEVAPERRAN